MAYREGDSKPDGPGWWLRTVPNKYPALQIEGDLNRAGEGIYDRMNGVGAHEVIIETPDHYGYLHKLEDKNIEEMIWAYRDRIVELKKDPRFKYILIFKNHGSAAGASLSHPHSQLIALPVVPKRVNEEIDGAKNYYSYRERCVFCDIIAQELKTKTRVVSGNDDFLAFEPYTSRFPFETWIVPKKHDSLFEDIQKHTVARLSKILKETIARISSILDNPPYNYIIHNSPAKALSLPYYHWHIEIIPKLTKVAGFEWGTGFYINPTTPEEAARFLRDAEI